MIREVAHAYAKADRAMICWTLGITEHHNAVDNVLALINLGLLTGHVGRYGSGLNPLRGQNNVQGGGDMGAIPNKLPGFQDIGEHARRARRFEAAWGRADHGAVRLAPYGHVPRDGTRRAHRGLLHRREPGELGGRQRRTRRSCSRISTPLIVQDIVMTKTAEIADVVFPASNAAFESEGTVTNSERRVQRVRKALEPPGEAKDDIGSSLSSRTGSDYDWGDPTAREAWDELRSLSPMHRGMSWERLEELGGVQWPCRDESHPGTQFLHARLWELTTRGRQGPAPFSVVVDEPPVDELTDEYPIRLTTGRRLDSFNTGVQSGGYTSPLRRQEAIELSPEDAEALGVVEGERVRCRRAGGEVEAPVHVSTALRPGLAFMTLHFPDQVETNRLTIEATDPKSGTAEFKATAIRVEKLAAGDCPVRRRGRRLIDLPRERVPPMMNARRSTLRLRRRPDERPT